MSIEVCIQKKFRGFQLDMAFQTASGQTTGILGSSGCGKSMTLKCIAGIETPHSGRIIINGKVLFDSEQKINIPPQKRKVGYLFQNYALFPHMTILGNIKCGLRGKQDEDKIWGLLEKFQLIGLEKRYPSQISGGQQQRVALVRILAYEPEILLLDEPFSALDSHLKEKLQLDMRQTLANYPGDALLVSHSRDEIYQLSPNLIIMDKGIVLKTGSTKDTFKNPEYLQAAKLTGCKNFSRAKPLDNGKIEATDWGITLHTNRRLTAGINYIGIRAHDFKPLNPGQKHENSFPVTIKDQIESPFEWTVVFHCKSDSPVTGEEIWWKYSKEGHNDQKPTQLYVDPLDILLLSGKH